MIAKVNELMQEALTKNPKITVKDFVKHYLNCGIITQRPTQWQDFKASEITMPTLIFNERVKSNGTY